MLDYDDLPEEDKKELYNKAFTWKHDHADHVARLMKESKRSYAPSGLDLYQPELWRAPHWNWFVKLTLY